MHAFHQATDPTVNNDETQGFEEDELWFNTVSRRLFECDDPATGAAVWIDITAPIAPSTTVVDDRVVLFDGTAGIKTKQGPATGAQLATLIGGGDADPLHMHASAMGDVSGPAGATDDRMAAFDGTTGKLIKQGTKTVTQVADHLDSTSDPHNVTAAQTGAYTTAQVDALVDPTLKAPEAFAPSGSYPITYDGGPVSKGDTFRITAAGTMGGITVNVEDLSFALVDVPGQTDANWHTLESNRDQATETVKGVAEIATQVEADAGTDDARIITAAKLAAVPSLLLVDGTRELTGDLAVTALKKIDGRDLSVDGGKLDGIETGATADQSAAEVPFTPNGDIAATDVQAAIQEVRDDTDTKLAATGGADLWEVRNANNAIFPNTDPANASSRSGLPILEFGIVDDETVDFVLAMSRDYLAGVITTDIDWLSDAIIGAATWGIQFKVLAPGAALDSATFTAQRIANTNTDGTVDGVTRTSITSTQAQAGGVAAGDIFVLRVQRVKSDGADDMSEVAQVLGVIGRQ